MQRILLARATAKLLPGPWVVDLSLRADVAKLRLETEKSSPEPVRPRLQRGGLRWNKARLRALLDASIRPEKTRAVEAREGEPRSKRLG
jgi:hypothetical protein